jgi:hypothetical protein
LLAFVGKWVNDGRGENQIVKIADFFLLSKLFTFGCQNLRIWKQRTT